MVVPLMHEMYRLVIVIMYVMLTCMPCVEALITRKYVVLKYIGLSAIPMTAIDAPCEKSNGCSVWQPTSAPISGTTETSLPFRVGVFEPNAEPQAAHAEPVWLKSSWGSVQPEPEPEPE